MDERTIFESMGVYIPSWWRGSTPLYMEPGSHEVPDLPTGEGSNYWSTSSTRSAPDEESEQDEESEDGHGAGGSPPRTGESLGQSETLREQGGDKASGAMDIRSGRRTRGANRHPEDRDNGRSGETGQGGGKRGPSDVHENAQGDIRPAKRRRTARDQTHAEGSATMGEDGLR